MNVHQAPPQAPALHYNVAVMPPGVLSYIFLLSYPLSFLFKSSKGGRTESLVGGSCDLPIIAVLPTEFSCRWLASTRIEKKYDMYALLMHGACVGLYMLRHVLATQR